MDGFPHLLLPRRRFLGTLGSAGLAAWSAGRVAGQEPDGKSVTVSIFNTTDLHGHILPTKTYEGRENVGGMARCVTQIRKWQAENPNHILLDIGDVYQGTHVSRSTDGQLMIDLFNKLKYDAWVIGNHEFDWGVETLIKSVERSTMPVLASNAKVGGKFTNQLQDKSNPLTKVAPWLVKEVAGFRIGIIGSVTPGLPAWLSPGLLKDFFAADPLKSVQYAIRKLKELKVDAIVLACHFGLKGMRSGTPSPDDFANRVNEITAACREVDVVLAGHTHRDIGQAEVNGIPYSQASYYGIHAGRVDLTFDRETRKLTGKSVRTVLMDGSIEGDAMVLATAHDALGASQAELDRVIGEFSAPLPARDQPGEPPAALLLITRAIRYALEQRGEKIDGVLHGLFLADDLPAGRKTIADMWDIIPYENRIATAELSGAELPAILEEAYGASFSSTQLDGFRVTVEGRGKSRKVTAITLPDGSPVVPEKRYRIALNAYDAQSGGRRYERLNEFVYQKEAALTLHAAESRDALIEFVSARKTLGPDDLKPV